MEEIGQKLIQGLIRLEVMKVLWSGWTSIQNIIQELKNRLEVELDSMTITQILNLMEKNGYVRSELNRIELTKSYSLTLEGKSLYEYTWQTINCLYALDFNHRKLVKWISLHLASRNISISENMIENSLRNYKAEELLREYLRT